MSSGCDCYHTFLNIYKLQELPVSWWNIEKQRQAIKSSSRWSQCSSRQIVNQVVIMQQFSFLIWLGLSHLSALCYLIMQLHSKNYLFINSAKLLQFDQVSLKFMDSESNISIKPSICLQITFFFLSFLPIHCALPVPNSRQTQLCLDTTWARPCHIAISVPSWSILWAVSNPARSVLPPGLCWLA